MKNLIRTLSFILLTGIVVVAVSCNNPAQKNTTAEQAVNSELQAPAGVKVYYFHATRRCATCEAVEAVSKEALKAYYEDKVPFESIDREEEKDNPLLEKYEIEGQTLLIIKGDKVVDLTNVAFMNARNNPDKLKSRIKTTIDSML